MGEFAVRELPKQNRLTQIHLAVGAIESRLKDNIALRVVATERDLVRQNFGSDLIFQIRVLLMYGPAVPSSEALVKGALVCLRTVTLRHSSISPEIIGKTIDKQWNSVFLRNLRSVTQGR